MDSYANYIGLVLEDRYKLRRLVGMGGMAMVFEAEDMLKQNTVAVKILKEEFVKDEQFRRRFLNESFLDHLIDPQINALIKFFPLSGQTNDDRHVRGLFNSALL